MGDVIFYKTFLIFAHLYHGRVGACSSRLLTKVTKSLPTEEGLVCAMLFVGALTGVQCEHSRGRTMYAPTDVRFMFVRNTRRLLMLSKECDQKQSFNR